MKDSLHLQIIKLRLKNEKERLVESKNENERYFREVQVIQIEKELKNEKERLGILEFDNMSDDDLLKELGI